MTRYPVVATRRRRWPWTGRLRLSQRGRGGRQAGEARETAPGSGGRRSKRSTLPRRRRWDRAFLATAEQFRSTLRTQESLVVEEDVKPAVGEWSSRLPAFQGKVWVPGARDHGQGHGVQPHQGQRTSVIPSSASLPRQQGHCASSSLVKLAFCLMEFSMILLW
ncbi:hypothetical protein C2845_PM17G11440 [Panicum miliaceum]|uniref:Uncharacterized protein n=1 Tax=Panicum miliaceum TaxID=4540 RepID=A0A3L6Q2J5_PANMI|nr:hypothetical protein C2845_PM17G11440 [Panicum miliaceum]